LYRLKTNKQLDEEVYLLIRPTAASTPFKTIPSLFKPFKKPVENHATLKKLSRREQKLKVKPWITKDILISIKKKRLMYKTHFCQGSDIQKLIYKKIF